MKQDLDLLHKLLATTSAFIHSTAPSRVITATPWIGTVARLLACSGYVEFEPGDGFHVKRANMHWRAMHFLLRVLIAWPKPPDGSGTGMNIDSLLVAFRDEFDEKEREILAKMPDEAQLANVEVDGIRFAIAEPLASDLRQYAAVLEQPCEVEPADEYSIAVSDFLEAFLRYERLLPGEFAYVAYSTDEADEADEADEQGFAFTVDPALLRLLHGKVLRRMWIKRIEGREIRRFDFVVISDRADASRCTPEAIDRWAAPKET